jgi:hypothetical protein
MQGKMSEGKTMPGNSTITAEISLPFREIPLSS